MKYLKIFFMVNLFLYSHISFAQPCVEVYDLHVVTNTFTNRSSTIQWIWSLEGRWKYQTGAEHQMIEGELPTLFHASQIALDLEGQEHSMMDSLTYLVNTNVNSLLKELVLAFRKKLPTFNSCMNNDDIKPKMKIRFKSEPMWINLNQITLQFLIEDIFQEKFAKFGHEVIIE